MLDSDLKRLFYFMTLVVINIYLFTLDTISNVLIKHITYWYMTFKKTYSLMVSVH